MTPLRRRLASAGAVGLLAGSCVVVGSAPSYAEIAGCEGINEIPEVAEGDVPVVYDPVTAPSAPLEQLQVADVLEELDRRGVEPGEGVGVAVVDAGLSAPPDPPSGAPWVESGGVRVTSNEPAEVYYRGMAMAGLIAGADRGESDGGPIGIAPAASLIDVKVYDAAPGVEGSDVEYTQPTPLGVAEGLTWVADNARALDIEVVNVSLTVADDPALEAAVARLVAMKIIVVAATGDRPADTGDEEEGADPLVDDFGVPRPGEDAGGAVFPAGYPGVVGATTTAPDGVDLAQVALASSAIDIAVPTQGAVSYALTGDTCVLGETTWTPNAAAQVSGIVAMLRSVYPRDRPAQTLARLYGTATGSDTRRNRFNGHGIAQPYEALTQVLEPRRDGELRGNQIPEDDDVRATPPAPEPDVLASTRDDAVWWGLLGGGALLVAALLRPVLARRRR